MTTPCDLCGHDGVMTALYPKQEIVECPRCGLVFYDGPVPGALYGADYFAGGEYQDYVRDRKVLQRNFRRLIPKLTRFAPSGRLLEIGAAFGFFLELARERWQVRGIDVSPEGVARMRAAGVDAVAGDFLTLPEEPERYDLICMWDTVEHLTHPVRYIEKAARWLKPGGTLAMTTGDIGSPLARFRKERWRQIHPPTHLFYFSAATLGEAVARAGLEVCHRSYVGYSRSFQSMLYGICVLGREKAPWLYRLATLGERLDFSVYLNLYDILLLIARKPGGEGTVRRNVIPSDARDPGLDRPGGQWRDPSSLRSSG